MKLNEIESSKPRRNPWQPDKEGNIDRSNNPMLLSLEGAPQQNVPGDFLVNFTGITSLKGAPRYVRGNFSCYGTPITSLEGAPEYVGKSFECSRTKITSLHNVHKIIKHMERFHYYSGPLKSNILGLCLIPGLTGVCLDLEGPIDVIMNKYLGGNPENMLMCQQELIEAGFPLLAKL